MRRITAGIYLVAGVVSTGVPPALSEEVPQAEPALVDQTTLPNAIELKGARPKADPSVLAPAADSLPPSLEPLVAPPSLALPDAPSQVRIHELRPLTLEEALRLAEYNNPTLKAAASQVDQAKSALRAEIAAWYPTVDLSASGLPEYFKSYSYQNPDFVPDRVVQKPTTRVINPVTGERSSTNPNTGEEFTKPVTRDGFNERYGREWRVNLSLQVSWDLINPRRVPDIAAARDSFERAGDSYLIALRDLRLQSSRAYFNLQEADEGVRIAASVKASLVSLRTRAR